MATHHSHGKDRPAVHGMLVIGEQTVYVSHLPMFMSPHDYQVILEVNLSNGGSAVHAAYVKDRKTNAASLCTLEPTEAFTLPS